MITPGRRGSLRPAKNRHNNVQKNLKIQRH